MLVRPFLMDDYPAVCALWRDVGPGLALRPSDEPEEVAKKLRRDPDLFLIAEEEGQVVGVIMGPGMAAVVGYTTWPCMQIGAARGSALRC